MNSNFDINLNRIMKEKKITNKVLAEWITDNYRKISKETIAKYRNGDRTPDPDLISVIAKYFNVNEQYFFDGNDDLKVKYIPLIGVASCGVPNIAYNDSTEYIPVSSDLARDGVYAVTADGDSMLPKIQHGSIVICDKNMPCENGSIVHYTTIDGESGLKKYLIDDKGVVTLMPLNSDFMPIMCDKKDLRCARAFKIQSDL